MTRLVRAGLRDVRAHSLLLVAGVAAVVGSATLLGSAASTTQLNVEGTLARSFRPAYDILVRPASDVTAFERTQHLVRANYLSDLFGGISARQLAEIERIPGISAAPVENVGYVIAQQTVFIRFHPPRRGPAHQLFRFSARFDLPGDTVSWGSAYLYVARRDRFLPGLDPPTVEERMAGVRSPVRVCGAQSVPPDEEAIESSPYAMGKLDGYVVCYSERSPASGSFPGGRITVPVTFDFPMLLSAIDPRAEAALFGLRRALDWGHYLSETDTAHLADSQNLGPVEDVPVLASSSTDLDERLVLSTQLVAASNGRKLPAMLASQRATSLVSDLPAISRRRAVEPAAAVYRSLLVSAERAGAHVADLPVPEYWVTSQPRYVKSGTRSVSVIPQSSPASVWRSASGWGNTTGMTSGGANISYTAAPPGNDGSGYESLSDHYLRPSANNGAGTDGEPPVTNLDVVGTFDPAKLPGYSALSRVPLETFSSPVDEAANRATERAIGGRVLGPTSDLAGYVSQPPLLLTTLAAARTMLAHDRYTDADASAPISAVLVRLDGPIGIGAASRERLEETAVAIRQATGLRVDITDGSSPTSIIVHLGRRIELDEQWARLGVAYDIVRVTDTTTALLLGVAGLSGALFVASAASAIVRRRRKDLAVLSALGWQRGDLARAVTGAIGVLACLGTVLGVGVALLVASLVGAHLGLLLVAVALAVSPTMAAAASLPAIVAGTRVEVAGALAQSERPGGRTARRLGLAWANVRTAPGRAALGAAALAVSLGAFGVVAALERALTGRLAATRTVLGDMIELHVRGLDVAAAAVVVVLGVAAVVNVTLASASERRRWHAVLSACGWASQDVVSLVLTEAAVVGVLGVGGGFGFAALADATLSLPFQLLPLIVAALASLLVVLVAVGAPVAAGIESSPALVLGGVA